MRKFPAHQLAEAEAELASLGFLADHVSFDVGDHSDEIHWDDTQPVSAEGWLKEIEQMHGKLARAEGLLRAYELFRKANLGETDDNACAG